jgi:hypothetical protein
MEKENRHQNSRLFGKKLGEVGWVMYRERYNWSVHEG